MERHDIELKQKHDSEHKVISESVCATKFTANILFEYKEKEYMAWGILESGGELGDCYGVDLINGGEVNESNPLFDSLHDIAKELLENFKITRENLEWE